jgi:hypothetical protein
MYKIVEQKSILYKIVEQKSIFNGKEYIRNIKLKKCIGCNKWLKIFKYFGRRYKTKDFCYSCMAFCIHNIRKCNCKECGENAYCEHNTRKYDCDKCDGGICEHDKHKRKNYCRLCVGDDALCNLCKIFTKNPKYKNYCSGCFYYLNPKLRKITKQNVVDEIYKNMYPDFKWESKDSILPNTCGLKRRPDYFIDYGTHCLILEIDENQHNGYNEQCEISRINQISIMVNDRPTIYIRFNPDSYVDKNGKKIKSCFSLTPKLGKLKCDEDKIKERLVEVHKKVLYFSNYENVKNELGDLLIKQVKMFYD